MGMASDVTEDDVHTKQAFARADLLNIIVGHGVKERDTTTFTQYFLISCCKQAV